MLEQELRRLSSELPASIYHASIQLADIEFALETLTRHPHTSNWSRAIHQAASGIAWERAVITRVRHLAENNDALVVVGERWQPAQTRLDLDLIVHDHRKAVTWILDAKLTKPHESHVGKMRDQISLLKRQELTDGYPMILGIIVHHRRQLAMPREHVDDSRILRCTLQEIGNLLLARRPLGEQAPTQRIQRAA